MGLIPIIDITFILIKIIFIFHFLTETIQFIITYSIKNHLQLFISQISEFVNCAVTHMDAINIDIFGSNIFTITTFRIIKISSCCWNKRTTTFNQFIYFSKHVISHTALNKQVFYFIYL